MTSRQRSVAFITAVAVVVGCLVVIAFVLSRLKAPVPPAAPPSEADARELIENGHVGLAHLENHDTAKSIPLFTQIAEKLPHDPLGPRNLAVSHVLALGEDFEHATPERIADAYSALKLVEVGEGRTPEWRWLSARVAAAAEDYSSAEEHLRSIIAQDQSNASAWYELYIVRRAAGPASAQSAPTTAALRQAFRLRPRNLYLLVEYFRHLENGAAARLAEISSLPAKERPSARENAVAAYGDLPGDLRLARESLVPFQDRIRALSGVDVVQIADESISAAGAGDLETFGDRAGQMARVMLGVAASDRNLVRRHVLEFVLSRYRPEFYEQYAPPGSESAPIEVSFDAAPEWQFGEDVAGKLNNVQSLEIADFDLDGRPDLIVLDEAGAHVFARGAGAGSWQQIAAHDGAAGAIGLVVQDLDLDFDETPSAQVSGRGANGTEDVQAANGATKTRQSEVARRCPSADVDIVAYGPKGVVVLQNRYAPSNGTRSLEPIEQAFGMSEVTAATAADLDGDGDLDLVVAAAGGVALWSNRGNATFEDISRRSSLPPADREVTALVALDWDRDVDVDIVIGGAQAGWLENLRHGQTRWHAFEGAFVALSSARELEPIDADANGSWDLLAATSGGLQLVSTATPQPGVVRALETLRVSSRTAQHMRMLDYDNDGVMDIVAWDSAEPAMYRGLAEGRFQAVELIEGAATGDCRSGDLDRDGDLDLVVAGNDGATIYLNRGGNQNKWLDVALVARQVKGGESSASGRVNAHGVGSLLELNAGKQYQPAVVRGQSTHFGLGKLTAADTVRAMWLNGVPQNILQPAAEQEICEQQVLTGSCPYLYTWNGKEFEFVTDLLWAAPLGLQAADGVLLPWRDWEYLKIPGEKLAAKDGEYILQITEELWEAAYFDQVKLIAVDHPASVDIYSNEKVGPPDIAEFKIHTAGKKRRPVAARNHRGRDLLGELADEDGKYAKPFDEKLRQGLVEAHFMELDLGDLGDAKQITVFLTGWIYPSGTSLNVAISQNPELIPPRPPALLVPDGKGGWREALANMGFPGGKTKTIAIDLSGHVAKDDSRIRIATNLELYWDQVFFTVDEPTAELVTTELELKAADLHYRGFSRIVHDDGHGPERFVYGDFTTAPKWPTMQGCFTRFGDVMQLLDDRDDRLVVLGAGDEVTLRFRAAAGDPPAGYKRDFILYSVGWDKDANLCTVAGETVEPLPFEAMRNYPPSAHDRSPGSEMYRQYLRKYQTRRQSSAFWRNGWRGENGRASQNILSRTQ